VSVARRSRASSSSRSSSAATRSRTSAWRSSGAIAQQLVDALRALAGEGRETSGETVNGVGGCIERWQHHHGAVLVSGLRKRCEASAEQLPLNATRAASVLRGVEACERFNDTRLGADDHRQGAHVARVDRHRAEALCSADEAVNGVSESSSTSRGGRGCFGSFGPPTARAPARHGLHRRAACEARPRVRAASERARPSTVRGPVDSPP